MQLYIMGNILYTTEPLYDIYVRRAEELKDEINKVIKKGNVSKLIKKYTDKNDDEHDGPELLINDNEPRPVTTDIFYKIDEILLEYPGLRYLSSAEKASLIGKIRVETRLSIGVIKYILDI